MRRAAVRLLAGAVTALLFLVGACHAPAPPRATASLLAACPRDAHRDSAGRCACDRGDVPVLGACVPPPVADAYCGPAARAASNGACVFRACTGTGVVDVDTGCISAAALLHGGPRSCEAGASLAVEDGRSVCIPADAACPRGAHADGAACVYPPTCPPGTLVAPDGSCRPVVLRAEGTGGSRLVDLGAWAVLALGIDGGPGSANLCRPIRAHPAALELGAAEELSIHVRIALSVPGNDVTRVSAEVQVATPGAPHPLPPAATTLAEGAVATLLEPLRGLGGETTATRVDLEVRCTAGVGGRSAGGVGDAGSRMR